MMEWAHIVQDDGKDGCFLAAFADESEADACAERIGPAHAYKVPMLCARRQGYATAKRTGGDA